MASSGNTVLEMEVQVNGIIKDIRGRINRVFDEYTDDNKQLPKLPDFDTLRKTPRLLYETACHLTDCIDSLLEVKIRVNLVRRSLSEMLSIQATSRSDYTFINNFKNNLKAYDDELSEYWFLLTDLVKNANNKLRILESTFFYGE